MTAWILSLLIAAVPPGLTPRETEADAIVRYVGIAEDAAAVAAGPEEGALIAAIAVHESRLDLAVDQGLVRGDGAVCLMQLQHPPPGAESDRRICFAEGLRLARQSLGACRALPIRERLASYCSGRCELGRVRSREIVDIWQRLLWAHPFPSRARS